MREQTPTEAINHKPGNMSQALFMNLTQVQHIKLILLFSARK